VKSLLILGDRGDRFRLPLNALLYMRGHRNCKKWGFQQQSFKTGRHQLTRNSIQYPREMGPHVRKITNSSRRPPQRAVNRSGGQDGGWHSRGSKVVSRGGGVCGNSQLALKSGREITISERGCLSRYFYFGPPLPAGFIGKTSVTNRVWKVIREEIGSILPGGILLATGLFGEVITEGCSWRTSFFEPKKQRHWRPQGAELLS